MISNDKIYNAMINFPSYKDCINLMPKNSIYIILQLNKEKSQLYYGCFANGKQ